MKLQPRTVEEVQEMVCIPAQALPRGGGSKPALSTPPAGVAMLDLSRLRGVIEYQPAEFTFTALAGTPLAEVIPLLAEHGQSLPFDPPLAGQGATLGGTVAAGLSGPGRYQYGGVRDFVLGVRYVDGEGRLIYGGGRVVKNAAGFDLPKLMVSSLGRLGVLVELTFKVFPRPEAFATLRLDCPSLEAALEHLQRLSVSSLDLHAIEIVPAGAGATLWARLAGSASAMPARMEDLRLFLGGGAEGGGEVLQDAGESDFWDEMGELAWVPQDWSLVKAPLTPRRIPGLEASLGRLECMRRYSGGGQMAWIALPYPAQVLDEILFNQGLAGLAVYSAANSDQASSGSIQSPRLGVKNGGVFAERVKKALDPGPRFLEL